MKKKFSTNLKEKKLLPLSLLFLEENQKHTAHNLLKYEKATKINAAGYELFGFYKVISKF